MVEMWAQRHHRARQRKWDGMREKERERERERWGGGG